MLFTRTDYGITLADEGTFLHRRALCWMRCKSGLGREDVVSIEVLLRVVASRLHQSNMLFGKAGGNFKRAA